MRGLLLALIGIAGCTDYDSTWEVRIGIPAQPLTRADLAIANQASLGPGDAWISIRSYDGADVVYPITDDGTGLFLESPFDPTRSDSHAALVTSTRLSQDTEPATRHPSRQYATVIIDAIVAPAARDVTAAGTSQRITIELEIPTAGTCSPPAPTVSGTVTGCFAGGDACDAGGLASRDGLYRAGPLGLSIEVLGQQCVE